MCKKQDTKVINTVNRLFALDVLVMGILLSILGWGSLEIVANNEALASLTEKHVVIDKSFDVITKTSEAILRVELSQQYYNNTFEKDITHIKESLVILNDKVNNK